MSTCCTPLAPCFPGSLATSVGVIYLGLAVVLPAVRPVLLRAHGLTARQYFTGAWPGM